MSVTCVIVGAGSIGCYVGGRLVAGGADVVFVGRSNVLDPLAAAGLTVSDLDGFDAHVPPERLTFTTSCAQAAELARDRDVMVILCVKGPATSSASAEIARAFGAGIRIVSLQNGVENVARVRAAAPEARVFAGMVPYNVVWPQDTHVRRSTGGTIVIADADQTRPLAEIFRSAGIAVRLETDMPAVQWGKLLINLNNPINALSGLPLRDEFRDRNYRRVWSRLISEGLAVLRAARIVPAKVISVRPEILARLLPLPNAIYLRLARQMANVDPTARSSMADDVRLGRVTEIDDLCGAIVRLGTTVNVETPANARMVELIRSHDGTAVPGDVLLQSLSR